MAKRLINVLFGCAFGLGLLIAQPGHAVIAVTTAQGSLQYASAGSAHVVIAGKRYAIARSAVIVGARSLAQIPRGAHVTAILSADGKTVMRLIVSHAPATAHGSH